MSLIKSNAVAPPPASGGSLSSISEINSLRFDGTSSYLSRTPTTAGNRKTWTWSGWVKRGNISTASNMLFDTYSGANDSSVLSVYFYPSDDLTITGYTSSWRVSSQVFRDTSAWYHIVITLDTTQATAADRLKLFVNGTQVTSFGTSVHPSLNLDLGMNQTSIHTIGKYANGSSYYFNGYLANIQFIDGQALDANSFGETVSDVWVPKEYSGTYGTNGFHLDFADANNIGNDVSGRGNHWTVN